MAQSLAVKYRPKLFDDCLGQASTIKILQQQLSRNAISNCYLFCGESGVGKTTLARAFANLINNNEGTPIEIDGASNNGVDAVRTIISDAQERSVESTYKIYIIDECHAISGAAWQAFLKCLEEPPQFTIFMFCTTNPEKIPVTILNRVMRFNLTKVSTDAIYERLKHICQCENFSNFNDACDFIAKLSDGGVRDAISTLEKCANYSTDLSMDNVLTCLGDFSYDSFFNLTGAIVNADEAAIIDAIENYYSSGVNLKLFVERYLDFTLDITKYCLTRSTRSIKIPANLISRCDNFASIPNALKLINMVVDLMLEIKNAIKYDTNIKITIEAMFIRYCQKELENTDVNN